MSPAPLLLQHIVTSGQKWRKGDKREIKGEGIRKDTAEVLRVWWHFTVSFLFSFFQACNMTQMNKC